MQGTKREIRPGVWEIRVPLGKDPATGRYRQLSRTVHGGARDANRAISELQVLQTGDERSALGRRFGQLLDAWLGECERLELSPTTLRNYRSHVKRTIRPALGAVPLDRLSARNLDILYGEMRQRGLTTKTIRNHHAVISAALHQGVRWGWIRQNVAEMARPPKVRERRVRPPSVEVIREVVARAEERDPRLAPMLLLAAITGLRRGELCALRWSDLDLERHELSVARSVVVIDGGLAEKSTKTDREREIALDPVAMALLQRHRAQVDEWARAACSEVGDDGFIFSPYVDGSRPFRPDNVTHFFIGVRDSLSLPGVRLHDLRHFMATQLIGAGMDVRTVAGRLGHSDASMTLRVYSHVLEERDRVAATIMGQLFTTPLGP